MSYNHEIFKNLTDNQRNNVFDKINDIGDCILPELVQAFRNGEEFTHPIKLSPGTVKAVWRFYSTFNFVREEHTRYLTDMRDTISYSISFLYMITFLCGHTSQNPDYDLQDEDYEMSELEIESFVYWLDGFYISDYGFPKLLELQCELWASDDLIHILITIDRIMNVWHGSGPLADRFIHGGLKSLNELSFSTELQN